MSFTIGDPERNRTSNWGLGIPRYIRLTTGPSPFRPSNLASHFQANLEARPLWHGTYYDILNANKKAATYKMGGFFSCQKCYVLHFHAAMCGIIKRL